ncbi:MAG: GTP-binding protein [Cyanothece sp. SIO2G6]|nr:GTP-binding protein [Cyanothece sp. SIO2G6]
MHLLQLCHWHPDEPRKTRLVFIGHNRDVETITQAVKAQEPEPTVF